MNAPPALATRPPSPRTTAVDDELTLAALLDLFAPDEAGAAHTSLRGELRARAARLRPWTRDLVQRAALWGAGPQGAWRAW